MDYRIKQKAKYQNSMVIALIALMKRHHQISSKLHCHLSRSSKTFLYNHRDPKCACNPAKVLKNMRHHFTSMKIVMNLQWLKDGSHAVNHHTAPTSAFEFLYLSIIYSRYRLKLFQNIIQFICIITIFNVQQRQ